jgi:Homeodomain-like domain
MFPQENPQQEHALPSPKPKPKHNGKYCSTENRQRIINALAAGEPIKSIAHTLHVSEHTVYAVAEQDWQQLANRKARIAAQFERIATKACDLLAQKLDTQGHKLTANQLVPIAGVAADKLLVLRGDPNVIAQVDHTVHIGNIFEAFQQFHNDARKIIETRQAQEEPQTFPALPDSPPAP